MENLSGKQLGSYRVLGAMGEGGMASVYKAYQPSMDRYVALKILPRHLVGDPKFKSRFINEAQLIAKLEHPNIIPVYDFGEADQYTYLAMRLLEGGSLANLMKQKHLSFYEINKIISQTGSALDYAHSLGIIHRDIKPANILVDKMGNCLLTDFGVAKMVEDSSELTQPGRILGTPAYIAPEQGMGLQVDGRGDVYSLGVILYQLITGCLPYNAETPLAVVIKHIHDPLPPPSERVANLPEGIEPVILKSLTKNPADRFQTAGEMASALDEAVHLLPKNDQAEPANTVSCQTEDNELTTRTIGTSLLPTQVSIPVAKPWLAKACRLGAIPVIISSLLYLTALTKLDDDGNGTLSITVPVIPYRLSEQLMDITKNYIEMKSESGTIPPVGQPATPGSLTSFYVENSDFLRNASAAGPDYTSLPADNYFGVILVGNAPPQRIDKIFLSIFHTDKTDFALIKSINPQGVSSETNKAYQANIHYRDGKRELYLPITLQNGSKKLHKIRFYAENGILVGRVEMTNSESDKGRTAGYFIASRDQHFDFRKYNYLFKNQQDTKLTAAELQTSPEGAMTRQPGGMELKLVLNFAGKQPKAAIQFGQRKNISSEVRWQPTAHPSLTFHFEDKDNTYHFTGNLYKDIALSLSDIYLILHGQLETETRKNKTIIKNNYNCTFLITDYESVTHPSGEWLGWANPIPPTTAFYPQSFP